MAKVIFAYERPNGITDLQAAKMLKVAYHTCLSFGITDFTVLTKEKFNLLFPFPVNDNFKFDDDNYVILEPERALEGRNGSTLQVYDHPEECTYVIWADYGTSPFDKFKNCDIVSIPTIENTCPLWAQVALGITLYDRFIKNGCSK